MLVFVPASTDADDYPEEENPEPPPNTRPYLLEPPFNVVYLDEEFEWEGRVAVEDNDTVEWNLITNMTVDDYDEFEWWPENYTFKLKIKPVQLFARWLNLSVTDNIFPAAYWNWTLFCIEDDGGTRGDDPLHHSDFYWCGSACGGDEYQWDDEDNWRDSATWTVNGYPQDNGDRAFFNETADSLYLVHGANSVVTIGELKLSAGFTGSVTMSIDLIIDDAAAHDGHMEVSAGTWDVNTSNEQINMDGYLYLLDTGTFVERAGIVIVQGSAVQQIRVQDSNKLYKFTVDSPTTVAEIYDNLTAFQITIGTATTYKMDPATRGYILWTNFTDVAGCGLVATSAGIWLIDGDSTNWGNVTTADAAPPPTNYYNLYTATPTFTWNHANITYSSRLAPATATIENVTFSNTKSGETYVFATTGTRTLNAFNNITISSMSSITYALYMYKHEHTSFDNVVIEDAGRTYSIYINQNRLEFDNSNFDIEDMSFVSTVGDPWVISQNHNDVANAYKIAIMPATSQSKSAITNDFATGDDVELISGKFIMDEDGAAKSIMAQDGTTLVLGKDVADASVTLTFDDTNWAGFSNSVANMGGIFAGKFYANGTATFPHIIRAVNLPATTGWRGINSYWPNPGYEHMVHNVTMYNTRNWATGHEALAQYSNITIDQRNVVSASAAIFVIWEPLINSFFNDISINGSAGGTEDAIYIMPDSVHVFLKNLVITNFSGDDEVEVDEGTTGEVVHFRNSNFDETNFDFWGGGEECHWISQDHNDTSGRYLTGIHATFNSSKSYVASGWDFGASDTVELLEGVLTLDEDADATSFFIEESDAGIEVLTTYTFDLTTNLTNNGTLINNGTITDSGGYFDFYNTNPGGMWFNNSTVSNAKLAYYYGGFNFSLGMDANSTINEWTLEAPSGIDTAFNITYYDFNNKGSGVIWHMNATAASGSVYFGTDNLTANERYDSYVDLILYREHTADAGGWVNFSYDGWSTRHIYLTWVLGGPAPPEPPGPGQYDRWIVGFEYSKNFFTNEVRFHAVFNYDHNASWYIWDFDGVIYESASPNVTRNFQFAFYSTENVKLTIIATDGNRYWMESPIILDNSLWIVLLCLAVISLAAIAIIHTRKERTKTELIMVETEGR